MASKDASTPVLLNSIVKAIKVSSVLDDNSKQFGKQHLIDGREDTCWNSDQGRPQSIILQWSPKTPIFLSHVELMFQGGFSATSCSFYVLRAAAESAGTASASSGGGGGVGNAINANDTETGGSVASPKSGESKGDDAEGDNATAGDGSGSATPVAGGGVTKPTKKLELASVYSAQDSNKLQSFAINFPAPVGALKIVFPNSTDFFGRIVVYKLNIYGTLANGDSSSSSSSGSGESTSSNNTAGSS